MHTIRNVYVLGMSWCCCCCCCFCALVIVLPFQYVYVTCLKLIINFHAGNKFSWNYSIHRPLCSHCFAFASGFPNVNFQYAFQPLWYNTIREKNVKTKIYSFQQPKHKTRIILRRSRLHIPNWYENASIEKLPLSDKQRLDEKFTSNFFMDLNTNARVYTTKIILKSKQNVI